MANQYETLEETAIILSQTPIEDAASSFCFPLNDIITCMANRQLQIQHDVDHAILTYSEEVNYPLDDCLWFWFESPEWTWEKLCGRAGWIVMSKSELKIIKFFLESMN